MDNELLHYGTPRHSGRYPWGSGENPYQHESWFLDQVKDLKDQGMTEKQIADAMGMSIAQLRAKKSIEKAELQKAELAEVIRLKDKGWSNVAIGERIGRNESYVRLLLDPTKEARIDRATTLANVLKEQVEQKPYLDVGKGVELQLGVTQTQMKIALEMLKEEGYNVHNIKVAQATDPNHKTEVLVLTKGETSFRDTFNNRDLISSPEGIKFEENGEYLKKFKYPEMLDSSRVQIRYYEDGGADKDGLIELRPGVEDISLGQNHYAQVRIAVDGTHYMKGMAMYNPDMPDGVDVIYNSSHHNNESKLEVMKKLKDDPINPFGASYKDQRMYIGADGKEHQSVINIVNDDTDWDKWSKNLSSQFLSKQTPVLAKKQLNQTYKEKEEEFNDICSLTNPTVKRKLLESFSDDCDSAAVHLKAAALPRQATHVILPINSLKDTEVYAPNYINGEEVVLIRYPHGGVFEIPRLRVNNSNPEGKSLLGNAEHAIGINSKVAAQLSGADFDGDTVVVIPTKGIPIRTSSPLEGLKGFETKERYPAYEGMPKVGPATGFHKQAEMGKVSNLITDMTLKGADEKEIARAVRHSMVVIDAEKHNLNWRQSYSDNGIAELKEKYQGGKNRGAATLISRAKSPAMIPKIKDGYRIDPNTGEKLYSPANEKYIDKNGKEVERKTTITKMENAFLTGKDAYSLSSGTRMENIYAEHANKLKALANKARKEIISTGRLKYSPSAKETYKEERESLLASLNLALRNAPIERQAQLVASKIISSKIRSNPELKEDRDALKKERSRALDVARVRLGAQRHPISITPRQWEAIQAGAISDSKLEEILRFADIDAVRQMATPRATRGMSGSDKTRARNLLNNGYTQAEVAKSLGVSVSTLTKELGNTIPE